MEDLYHNLDFANTIMCILLITLVISAILGFVFMLNKAKKLEEFSLLLRA